jgi:RHS repeat-associated protein
LPLSQGLHSFSYYSPRSNDPYLNRFIQPDSIVPGAGNPQSWNRYTYGNNPISFSEPTGHMETGACGYGGQDYGGNKGVTIFEKPDETEDSPKPKLRKAREKDNKSNAQIDFVFNSFDGAWNDPRYSTWNLLRQGSACTVCHVTHWTGTIPTNSEISLIQVQGWRLRKSRV